MDDKFFMDEALRLALISGDEGEVPVGAVVVRNGEIVGRGRNRREKNKNALAHAETEAIDEACKNLSGWRLWECEMYVTLEPCPMCTGAIINSRIRRLVFGAYDKKAGSCGSVVNLFELPYNHSPEVVGGFMEDECSALLKKFFEDLRKGINKAPDGRLRKNEDNN
ncbi:MAG: nucleoside deaminase [Clostridiales bacterium]|nr:nucleoside deaminase [Clostridiales bacterium]